MSPIIQFVVIAIVCALGLGVLSQFPNLDGTVVKLIRIVVLWVLSILFLNLILALPFNHSVSYYLTGAPR